MGLSGVIFLGFFSGIAGGCLVYVLFHWGHTRFQLGLDYRLSDLEGRVSREVKIRAGTDTQSKKKFEQDLLEKIQTVPAEPEITLKSWRDKAFVK